MNGIKKDNEKEVRQNDKGDIITLILTGAFIVAIATLIFIIPKAERLEKENRVAASLPQFSINGLINGSLSDGVADFYSDQLPFRDGFLDLRSRLELAFFRGESGGVISADGGYLIKRPRYGEKETELIEKNLNDFLMLAEEAHIDALTAVVPSGIDVMKCSLIRHLQSREEVWDTLPENVLTFDGKLRAQAENGEYVWYKTDHHYTTLGAYYVYLKLTEALGIEAYQLEYFDAVKVSDSFFGTSFSASGLSNATPDDIYLFRYPGDGEFTVTYGDTVQKGFYDFSKLETKDKYSVFLGGNHGLTFIKKSVKSRPVLVMIKDSYAHALAPFLALHFDITLVDPRYFHDDALSLLAESGAVRLVLFCGIDTLATTDLKLDRFIADHN